jgi:hypothetical protein
MHLHRGPVPRRRHQSALIAPRAVNILRGLALEHFERRDEGHAAWAGGIHGFCCLGGVAVCEWLLRLLSGIVRRLLRSGDLDFILRWWVCGGVIHWWFGDVILSGCRRRDGLGLRLRLVHFELICLCVPYGSCRRIADTRAGIAMSSALIIHKEGDPFAERVEMRLRRRRLQRRIGDSAAPPHSPAKVLEDPNPQQFAGDGSPAAQRRMELRRGPILRPVFRLAVAR